MTTQTVENQNIFFSRRNKKVIENGFSIQNLSTWLLTVSGSLYLYFDVFGGALRLILPALHLTLLLYLPAGLAIIAIIISIISSATTPGELIPISFSIYLVGIEIGLSFIVGRTIPEIALALYTWLPAFIMMILSRRGLQYKVLRHLSFIFIIAVTGVILNTRIHFPWTSETYEIAGIQRDAGKQWSTGGVDRLGGFSRASTAASAQILLGYCVIAARSKSVYSRAILWVLGLVGIYLTTSKSPIVPMIFLPLMFVLIKKFKFRRIAIICLSVAVLAVFVGPFILIDHASSFEMFRSVSTKTDNSLTDRVINTWPDAISLIDWHNPFSWITGRGLGGIGISQWFFEPPGNSGDNLAIYLLVSFGPLAFIFAPLILRGGARAANSDAPSGIRDYSLIFSMVGIASMANVIESIVPVMVLGMALTRRRPRIQT